MSPEFDLVQPLVCFVLHEADAMATSSRSARVGIDCNIPVLFRRDLLDAQAREPHKASIYHVS